MASPYLYSARAEWNTKDNPALRTEKYITVMAFKGTSGPAWPNIDFQSLAALRTIVYAAQGTRVFTICVPIDCARWATVGNGVSFFELAIHDAGDSAGPDARKVLALITGRDLTVGQRISVAPADIPRMTCEPPQRILVEIALTLYSSSSSLEFSPTGK